MLNAVLATIVAFAFGVALLVTYTLAISAGIIWLTALQVRTYRNGLRTKLIGMRRRHYRDEGLNPGERLLDQLSQHEAVELLSAGTAASERELPRWTLNLSARVRASLAHPQVMADNTGPARAQFKEAIAVCIAELEHRWRRRRMIICSAVGIGVALVFRYDAMQLLGLSSGTGSFSWSAFIPSQLPSLFDGTLSWTVAIGLLLTGIGFGIAVSAILARRMEPLLGRDQPPAPAAPQATDEFDGKERIGQSDRVLRAINFSAGGFDALMQLGVVHALLVIQGRAPDTVVGLSVGAVNAVALAEVLQAGEAIEHEYVKKKGISWSDLLPEVAEQLQRRRLTARVQRLREFIEAAQRAPERLLEALLPDAYQIDAARPLAPLSQPRFAPEERTQRAAFVMARTGLASLYNHLLNIPISIGTLVKVIRRVLGIRAATELPSMTARVTVYVSEGLRLWILLGLNLLPAATLVPILFRAYRGVPKPPPPATAAALIFRSAPLRLLRRQFGYAVGLIGLLAVWYVSSVFVFLFIGYLTSLVPFIGTALALFVAIFLFRKRNDAVIRNFAVDFDQGVATWLAMTAALTAFVIIAYAAFHPGMVRNPSLLVDTVVDHVRDVFRWVAIFVVALVVAAIVIVRRTRSNPRAFLERLLAPYSLNSSLFREHGLRAYLSALFDRAYYNVPDLDEAVLAALRRDDVAPDIAPHATKKKLSHYMSDKRLAHERIFVGLAVANTEKSSLDVVSASTPVVDGLMAATAVVPFLPPVELDTQTDEGAVRKALFIDGSTVSHEPTHALLKLLRKRRHPAHGPVHIYSVTPFPISKPELPEAQRPGQSGRQNYLNLIDIARRAMRLQRFRDASLERRLTELLSSIIPDGVNFLWLPGQEPFVRAWVTPVELDYDCDVNRRIWGADKESRRRIIEETIADGCRAALQVMIPRALEGERPIRCSRAVSNHLISRQIHASLKGIRIAESELGGGPGLPEICARCSLNRGAADARPQSLRRDGWRTIGPEWPHEREASEPTSALSERFTRPVPNHRTDLDEAWRAHFASATPHHGWPRDIKTSDGSVSAAGAVRPTVSLLFSGGVFRGVYQLGVLNALDELGIKPDLIGGASVGSITAAMIARAFSIEDDQRRKAQIARISAAFLSIDRLILTDRFADFVRNLTIRAAETRFSIRQADRVFRKYDYPTLSEFDRNTRRVVAGIERLLYVSPYQLNDVVRAIRTKDSRLVAALVDARVQAFLDRMQIGEEALGSEALRELIAHYVIPAGMHSTYSTDMLRENDGIVFLATTTNLSDGRLEVLGESPGSDKQPASLLTEALLASSAFPGVFRPRWGWELAGLTGETQRYVDGGVMDNLPMDAIARFLDRAGRIGIIKPYPRSPHLIVGASLEVRAPPYALAFTRERFKNSWLALRRRTKQLSYNTKLDTYEFAENAFRTIHEYTAAKYPKQGPRTSPLVGIHLLPIKPNWLCGTFAFHPMLGFQRSNQARSIAHGCATTLRAFATLKEKRSNWLADWRVKDPSVTLPDALSWSDAFERWEAERLPKGHKRCWLRKCDCPFARGTLEALTPKLDQTLIDEVSKIHAECLKPESHLRKI